MLAQFLAAVGAIEIFGDPGPERERILERLHIRPETSIDLEALEPKVRKLGKNWELGAVCCDGKGRYTIFLGWTQRRVRFSRPEVRAGFVLPEKYRVSYAEAMGLWEAAVRAKAGDEDPTLPYSYSAHPPLRAIQDRWRSDAPQDAALLRNVLRHAQRVEDRRAAALILPYAAPDQSTLDALAPFFLDSDPTVRNNALRGAGRMIEALPLSVPFETPLALLLSPVWTDRNKAAMILLPLSRRQPAEFRQRLRAPHERALRQMADWKASGHDGMGLTLLRCAGFP
jgi:hypothetical protein